MFKTIKPVKTGASLESYTMGDPIPFPADEWNTDILYSYNGMSFITDLIPGQMRTGTDPQGNDWSVQMTSGYGYFPNVIGADSEDLDVYIANPFNTDQSQVFIVDQINPKTNAFDEHKVMMGYATQSDAEAAYQSVFSDGSGASRMGAITPIGLDVFKNQVLKNYTKQPLSWSPSSEDLVVNTPPPENKIIKIKLTGDALCVPVIDREGNVINIYITTAFDTDRWGIVADEIIRLLHTATSNDVIIITIASPGGEVSLAARIASAIEVTQAHVTTRSFGTVASAACLLWVEGHNREIAPNSVFMQHGSSHGDYGKSANIERKSVALNRYIRDVILKNAAKIGMFTDDEISDMIDKDKDIYLTAQDVAARTGAKLLVKGEM